MARPTPPPMQAEALASAGRLLAQARAARDILPVHEAARRAYRPGGRPVEELEDLIRAQRDRARAKLTRPAA
ncbi:hypothetical protein AB0C10_15610 [Microbispora amethystogenes]|uniref:hypothetical protein n=1 Tax=Microbispora amethystogenes TaxID=1427754 RepID=UPI0033C5AAEC